MRRGDVEGVAAIEQASPSPWQASSLVHELARPQGLQLVAADDAEKNLLGWCCGLCATEEGELFKIAVAPHVRHGGVGTALLLRFEDLCRERGCISLFLEVRAANEQAIGLYEKLGYGKVGCRKNYYFGPEDDALILRKSILLQT
jgi:[ribosomal protein S18]-alanine N-acetyltransferase